MIHSVENFQSGELTKSLIKQSILVFIICIFGNNLHANLIKEKPIEKHYVNPKSIKITEKGIFVKIKGTEVSVKNLLVDDEGKIYYTSTIVEKKVGSAPCKNGCGWYIGRCCPKCNWPCEKERKK